MLKNTCLGLLMLCASSLWGQSILIKMDLSFDEIPLVLNQSYWTNANDSIQIETCKFYISQIELHNDDELVYTETNSFHLVDAADTSSLVFQLNPPNEINFTHLQFNLGIDSLTNMAGVMGGDLDPTKGMYWTWQSGYINFKLEGTSPVCDTRHHFFQLHLGGYAYPNNSCQSVRLETKTNSSIPIKVDIAQFLENIDLSQQNQIMSLGEESMDLSRKAVQIFSIQ